MVGRATGDDHDAAQILDLELGEADAVEDEPPSTRAVSDRLADRFRLLVDLLQHEGLIAALFRAFVVPFDRLDLLVLDLAVGVEETSILRCDRDDLAVVDQLHPPGLAQERGDRRREEHLAVADADDQRTLAPRADEQIGMVVVDRDEGEMPFEIGVSSADRFDQITGVVALDQMSDHLRVGLGGEHVTVGEQGALQLAVVLDDAVEHDRELSVLAARKRVRVLLVNRAVRRPARVTEPMSGGRSVRPGRVLQDVQVADCADVIERILFA